MTRSEKEIARQEHLGVREKYRDLIHLASINYHGASGELWRKTTRVLGNILTGMRETAHIFQAPCMRHDSGWTRPRAKKEMHCIP